MIGNYYDTVHRINDTVMSTWVSVNQRNGSAFSYNKEDHRKPLVHLTGTLKVNGENKSCAITGCNFAGFGHAIYRKVDETEVRVFVPFVNRVLSICFSFDWEN